MEWKGKKVLVTGGSGFIGSHLVDKLVELGADVTIVDIKTDAKNLKHLGNSVKFVNKDITEYNFSLPDQFDYIFHLAAYTAPSVSEKNPDLAFKTNVLGTYNLLKEALKIYNIKKIIFPSTAQLYGTPKYLPMDENHPIQITEMYAVSKKLGEDMCATFIREHHLPIIFLRLFNAFGPRQDSGFLIPTILSQAAKNQTVEIWNDKPTRDFTFVHDTVAAFIRAAETDFVGGPINIGSGHEVKIGDIARQITESFNVNLNVANKEVSGPMRLCCDNSLAKKILSWEPKVSFEEGLGLTIDWFKNSD